MEMAQAGDQEGFAHPALFYRGVEEYLAGTIPFVLSALNQDQPVAVAVPGSNLQLLGAELGGAAERVQMIDMTIAGRNPGRIIAEVLRAATDRHKGRHVSIVGEPIWAGRSAAEYPACAQHEALINPAFRGRNATILCPYDVNGLEPVVIEDAAGTHPVLIERGSVRPSSAYAPERITARYNYRLPRPSDPPTFAFDVARLRHARRFAVQQGRLAGLNDDRLEDLLLIAGELVANSLRHGGGSGTLRVWPEDRHLICEVDDAGRIDDPLVGRHPADSHQLSGRGLLVVNDLADLVRMHTRSDGVTVRAYLRL